MAWPFAGSWDGLGAQDLSTILASLMLALNEREEAQARTETQFYYNSGQKARPTAGELDGLSLNGSEMLDNLNLLQDNTITLISPFSYPSTVSGAGGRVWWWKQPDFDIADFWDLTGVEALTGPITRGDYVLHSPFLESLKDAFDLLTDCLWQPGIPNSGTITFTPSIGSSGVSPTISEAKEAAWQRAISDETTSSLSTETLALSTGAPWQWSPAYNVVVPNVGYTQSSDADRLDTENISGVLEQTVVFWERESDLSDYNIQLDSTPTVRIAGFDIVDFSDTDSDGSVEIGDTWPDIVANETDVEIEYTLPGSSPFTYGTIFTNSILGVKRARVNIPVGVTSGASPIANLTVFTDVSAALTDQA